MQKCLTSPKSNLSDLYYSRKMATYNFSVFDIATKHATCHIWHEATAKRGSCEVASCILKENLKASEEGVTEMIYYSDTCGGQQCISHSKLERITHHFFVRGHSQSEGDSVHARIENETKLKEIYTPNEWMMCVQNAKLTDPRYTVEELHTEEVMDLKKLVEDVMINYEKQNDGQQVKWTKIHSMEFRKESPGSIFYKYSINEDEFSKIEVTGDAKEMSTSNKTVSERKG